MRPLLALLALAACGRSDAGGEAPPKVEVSGPRAHFCNLRVFTDGELKRHQDLTGKMVAAVTGDRELDAGYEITFAGSFAEFGEWLDGDRRCCPTVQYDVEITPMAGTAKLRITGAGDAKAFIREEFARILKPVGATRESRRPTVVEFAADWCAACRVQERRMTTDTILAAVLQRFERVRIDVTTEDARTAALEQRYGVSQLPTLVVLDSNGATATRIAGTAEPMQLAAQLSLVH